MDEQEYQRILRSQELHLRDWCYLHILDEGYPDPVARTRRVYGTVASGPAPSFVVGQEFVSNRIHRSGQGWCETYRQRYYLDGPAQEDRYMTLGELRDLESRVSETC